MESLSSKEKIIRLRKLGFSYAEIGAELGFSKSTISFHLKSVGLGGSIDKKRRRLTKETKESIIQLFESGLSKKGISEKLNLSLSSVNKYTDNYPKKSKEEVRNSQYLRHQNWRLKIKLEAINYLGGSCRNCGYNKCVAALDFHHRDSKNKEFNITGGNMRSFPKLISELDKCDLLCANCHRELHNPQLIGIL